MTYITLYANLQQNNNSKKVHNKTGFINRWSRYIQTLPKNRYPYPTQQSFSTVRTHLPWILCISGLSLTCCGLCDLWNVSIFHFFKSISSFLWHVFSTANFIVSPTHNSQWFHLIIFKGSKLTYLKVLFVLPNEASVYTSWALSTGRPRPWPFWQCFLQR